MTTTAEQIKSRVRPFAPTDPEGWLHTGEELLTNPPPSPPGVALLLPETGEHLLREGRTVALVGDGGVGKSLLALSCCVEVALEGGKAVFLDWEGSLRDFKRRLHPMRAGGAGRGITTDPAIAERLYYHAFSDPFDAAKRLPEDTELIVVDSTPRAMEAEGLDENTEFGLFAARVLDPLSRHAPDATKLLIDHPGHQDKRRGRGDSKKRQRVDVDLTMERTSGRDSRLVLRKDRHADFDVPTGATVAEVQIRVSGDELSVALRQPAPMVDDEGHFRPTVLMGRVADYLQGQPDGASRNTVERDVTGNRDWIRRAIEALLREGCIREDLGRRNARILTFVRPPEDLEGAE